MKEFEVVYWELTRLSRIVKADTVEEAIAESENLRADHDWSDCEEETDGTNGVERVYECSPDGGMREVYTSGTVAGMIDPSEESAA